MVDASQDIKAREQANSTGSTSAGEASCAAVNTLSMKSLYYLLIENDSPIEEHLDLGTVFPLV